MNKYFFLLIPVLGLQACDPDPVDPPATYDSTPYELKAGAFPTPDLPADNKLTLTGVQLGRMVFRISANSASVWKDCRATGRLCRS